MSQHRSCISAFRLNGAVELTERNKRSEQKADLTSCHRDTVCRLTHTCVEILVCSVFSDESGMSHDPVIYFPLITF